MDPPSLSPHSEGSKFPYLSRVKNSQTHFARCLTNFGVVNEQNKTPRPHIGCMDRAGRTCASSKPNESQAFLLSAFALESFSKAYLRDHSQERPTPALCLAVVVIASTRQSPSSHESASGQVALSRRHHHPRSTSRSLRVVVWVPSHPLQTFIMNVWSASQFSRLRTTEGLLSLFRFFLLPPQGKVLEDHRLYIIDPLFCQPSLQTISSLF